jgi:hypothetical protein
MRAAWIIDTIVRIALVTQYVVISSAYLNCKVSSLFLHYKLTADSWQLVAMQLRSQYPGIFAAAALGRVDYQRTAFEGDAS